MRAIPDLTGLTISSHCLEIRVTDKCDSEGEAMTIMSPAWQSTPVNSGNELADAHWYALQTRARHEKVIAQRLREQGVTAFLPLVTETHRWSDRKKVVELPLFSCYLFVRLCPMDEHRLNVLRLEGVFRFVGVKGQGIIIPDAQIESVKTLLSQQIPYRTHPFLKIGQRVRIRSGALAGVEGILVAREGDSTLVVSVDAIQRSLAIRIEGYDVEAV